MKCAGCGCSLVIVLSGTTVLDVLLQISDVFRANFYTAVFVMIPWIHSTWKFLEFLRLFAVFVMISAAFISAQTHEQCSVRRDRHYTRDQLVALNTGLTSLDRDTRLRICSLLSFRARGCRAGGCQHKHTTHAVGDGGGTIPVITGNRRSHRCRHMSERRGEICLRTVPRSPSYRCSMNVNTDTKPPSLYVLNASSLAKKHAVNQ